MGLSFSSSDVFVYVHIPFCLKRCFYCDFVSSTDLNLIEDYFESVQRDIMSYGEILRSKKIRTLYFGGGTPSIVDPLYIARVIDFLSKYDFDPVEITVEMNPESTTKERLLFYKKLGVNRISLGVQAMNDDVLKISGRPHGTFEVLRALNSIVNVFDNFNLDFITGLPGYNESVILENLHLIEKFSPSHVSVYKLELHENTPLYKMYLSGKVNLPYGEDLFTLMKDALEEIGYERYEISNFAKSSNYSVHNLSYWYTLDYLGIGVSAGGYLERFRYVKTPDIREYIENPEALSYRSLNDDCQHTKEVLFMGLRLKEGVEKERILRPDVVSSISDLVVERNGRIIARDFDDPTVFERIANYRCS